MKIFLMKSERAFGLSIDSYATTTFKPHKGSKDMIKVIHVTPVVKPQFYEVTRVLCPKKHNLPFYLQNINLRCAFASTQHACIVKLS
jgi:hypothetical protein